jgi:hypothetical protein
MTTQSLTSALANVPKDGKHYLVRLTFWRWDRKHGVVQEGLEYVWRPMGYETEQNQCATGWHEECYL